MPGEDSTISPAEISEAKPVDFPLKKSLDIVAEIPHLEPGKYEIEIVFVVAPFGELTLKVEDGISA